LSSAIYGFACFSVTIHVIENRFRDFVGGSNVGENLQSA
jgi:hypothetical protein